MGQSIYAYGAWRRESMMEFFATSGDFTRRLTSIKANPKFSSPLAGPEDYYSVSQQPYLFEAISGRLPFLHLRKAGSNPLYSAQTTFQPPFQMAPNREES